MPGITRRRRAILWIGGVLVVGLVVAVALAVAHQSHRGPQLREAGNGPLNSIDAGIGFVRPNTPISTGSVMICMTGRGDATITRVRPWHPVGRLIVEGFAVRPNPFGETPPGRALGDADGTLSQQGFTARRDVAQVCDPGSSASELGLQLAKPTTADAGVKGWVVDYKVDGRTKTLVIPIVVRLCSADASDQACMQLDRALRNRPS